MCRVASFSYAPLLGKGGGREIGTLDWLYPHAHSVNGKGSWAEGGLIGLEVNCCWLVQRLNQWDSFQGWVPHLPRKRHRQQMHRRRRAARSARPSRDPRTMPAMAPGPRVGPGRNQEKGSKGKGTKAGPVSWAFCLNPPLIRTQESKTPYILSSLNISWMTVVCLAFCQVVKIHWWANQDTRFPVG